MDTIAGDPDDHTSADLGGSRHTHAQIKPRGKPYSRKVNWRLVSIVGVSIAAGAALGAGIALLTAPQSGEHTRLALARDLRRMRPQRPSPWDQLAGELQKVARRKRFRRATTDRG